MFVVRETHTGTTATAECTRSDQIICAVFSPRTIVLYTVLCCLPVITPEQYLQDDRVEPWASVVCANLPPGTVEGEVAEDSQTAKVRRIDLFRFRSSGSLLSTLCFVRGQSPTVCVPAMSSLARSSRLMLSLCKLQEHWEETKHPAQCGTQ